MGQTFLQQVKDEMIRTRALYPNQEENNDLHEWYPILAEEVGEVARDMNEYMLGNLTTEEYLTHIQYELVQVGAMALRMAVAADTQLTKLAALTANGARAVKQADLLDTELGYQECAKNIYGSCINGEQHNCKIGLDS